MALRRIDYEQGIYHSFSMGKVPGVPFSYFKEPRRLEPTHSPPKKVRPAHVHPTTSTSVSRPSRTKHLPPPLPRNQHSPASEGREEEGDASMGGSGSSSTTDVPPRSHTVPGSLVSSLTSHRCSSSTSGGQPYPRWTISDGWDKRPRPCTSASYQSFGQSTCASGRKVQDKDRPTSTYSSRSQRYTSLQHGPEYITIIPPKDILCDRSPGPMYNCRSFPPIEWPHRIYIHNKGLGGKAPKVPPLGSNLSFIPNSCGSGKLVYPCENQTRLAARTTHSLMNSRDILGSIYEEGYMTASPGPIYDDRPARKKLSQSRFEVRPITIGATLYGPLIKNMIEEQRIPGRRLRKALNIQREEDMVEDDSSICSASSQSIYHCQMRAIYGDDHRQGGWVEAYKDCRSVACFADKRAVVEGDEAL